MQATAAQICAILEGEIEGDPAVIVDHMARIEEANSKSVCFIANPKYAHYADKVNAGVLIVGKDLQVSNPRLGALIRLEDPYLGFTRFMQYVEKEMRQNQNRQAFTHPSAVIADDVVMGQHCKIGALSFLGAGVKLGHGVIIGEGAIIGHGVEIGNETHIHPGAKVLHSCKLGARCIIHSGAVIGSDGFGFAPDKDGTFHKIPQTGNVVLEDDVEVGSNTTIDRATMGSTLIRRGVKLDNLIQIGHNVEIGENTVMAGMSGVSGSTKIGKGCMIGGQVGIAGHISIADGVKINAQTGVSKSVTKAGISITGSPAMEFFVHYRMMAQMRRIPEILDRLLKLESNKA
jgi:UDP-3-O-[3-hydroxymyristoyl] glucosamine N-acyltransferase